MLQRKKRLPSNRIENGVRNYFACAITYVHIVYDAFKVIVHAAVYDAFKVFLILRMQMKNVSA